MEFIKEWTFCVCVTLVLSCILSLLMPRGNMQRFYKIVLALFIFVSFLYPLKDVRKNRVDFSAFYLEEVQTESRENTLETYVKTQVRQVLSDNGIVGADVTAQVYIHPNTGEAELLSLTVAVEDVCDTDEVKQMLFDALGFQAKVIHIGQ